jgi:hypothetical protein
VAVTLVAPELGVIVMLEDAPLVGVAPVIVHAYVGDVTFCVIAVSVAVDGVITPVVDLEKAVNPDMSTNGPTLEIGFQANDVLAALKTDWPISLPTRYAK